jgi:tetratricopeptide (TPR) repeat protein
MKRDLIFFASGLAFGIAAGYFVFRALAPAGRSATTGGAVAGGAASAPSTIGLDEAPERRPLDRAEIERLEAKAKTDPSDAPTRAEIGTRYMEAGQYEEAVPWLAEAVRLVPSDLHTRNHLAITYLNLGNLERAVDAFQTNLEADPEHPASLLGLGRIKLYLQQDIRGGLTLWEKLIAVAPDSPEAKAVQDELEALKSAHPPTGS